MGLWQNLYNGVGVAMGYIPVDPASGLPDGDGGDYRKKLDLYRDYAAGAQRRQVQVKLGKADDNVVLNYAGLVIDRSVSFLVGGGVKFDFSTEDEDLTENAEFIDRVWTANKRRIFLHKAADLAARYGTGYIKILPPGDDGDQGEQADVEQLPRLVNLSARFMTIETDPADIEVVNAYINRFNVHREGKTVAVKEETRRVDAYSWLITTFEASRGSGGRWVVVDVQEWPFPFPPIVHWQNLPDAESAYGTSELEDVIGVQDDVNYMASQIKRIIRYHASPRTWGKGFSETQMEKKSWGADQMVVVGKEGELHNLEMTSDLTASVSFMMTLKASFFDLARTVDLAVLRDKLGQLTNFGLRTIYQDQIAKLETKRELFGDALVEINRRLLTLEGDEGAGGGRVVWSDKTIPQDEDEESQVVERDMNNKLLSPQTASAVRGYDYEQEQELIAEAAKHSQVNAGELGRQLMSLFDQGDQANNNG